jgi:hypothetical protein
MFRYYYHHVNLRCVYFHLKVVVRPKHVADNLNKTVNNYISLDWYMCVMAYLQ